MRSARGNISKQTLQLMIDNPETHKRLKIHNVQSEAVNQKKGRQKTKGQTMIYKALQRKLKIEQQLFQ